MYHLAADWSRSELELLAHRRSLILLPQLLSRVSNDLASKNALNNLLQIVHKYPMSKYYYLGYFRDLYPLDELLYPQVVAAAEKYLGYSEVSVRF